MHHFLADFYRENQINPGISPDGKNTEFSINHRNLMGAGSDHPQDHHP